MYISEQPGFGFYEAISRPFISKNKMDSTQSEAEGVLLYMCKNLSYNIKIIV
jgi:hypothetical protein